MVILSKKKNIGPLHLDPQRLGQIHYNKDMVVINCLNIPKYTLIGYISLSLQMKDVER